MKKELLIRAYKEIKNQVYLDCAIKAGNFLLKNMDENGCCISIVTKIYHIHIMFVQLGH